jgi:hypothetical protein
MLLELVRRRDLPLLASCVVWLAFVINYNALKLVSGDEQVQYQFVQRLFGDRSHALGYYFGLGLVEAPFYALGKLLEHLGLQTIAGAPAREASVAFGLGLLTLLVWPLLTPILRGLDLPHAGFLILAAVIGTPFFFYATFEPGKNHALDAVLFSAVLYLVYRYLGAVRPERWLPPAIGALLGFSFTVRYFSGAEGLALLIVLAWYRRWRHAVEIAVTSAAVCLALFAIPRAFGVPVFGGGYNADNVIDFAPLNPLRMLFTDHRGYLVWSPVAVLAIVGLALLFRRRPGQRAFLVAATAMGIAIAASYSLIGFWDGTWSFSQRFYTPLLPLVVIGLGGLVEAAPRPAFAAAAVGCAWSLFLAFNLVTIGGPQYLSTIPGGASDLALVPARTHTSVGAYLWGVKHKSNLFR